MDLEKFTRVLYIDDSKKNQGNNFIGMLFIILVLNITTNLGNSIYCKYYIIW